MRIELADLGDWGDCELFSEYDPQGPVIRINARIVDGLPAPDRLRFVARAIAHELYHHMECTGRVPRIRDRRAREKAADAFAAHIRSRSLGCTSG